jgi:PKD repeat protein
MKFGLYAVLATVAAACALAIAPGSASALGCRSDTVDPVAAFSFSPSTPQPGSAVSFDASSSQPGSYTSYSYDGESQTCEIADSGEAPITSYTWHWGDGTSNTTTSSATTTHTFASPGAYDVSVTVNAPAAGTDSVSHTVTTAWQVTLTQPAASTFWTQDLKRQTITLAATAAGPEPVQRIEFYVRDVKVGQDTSAPYSVSFDTASIADGPAGVYARAVGTGGNAGDSATRNVKIDNTAPSFTIVSQPGVAQPGQDTFTVRFHDDEFLYGNALCWADNPVPVGWNYCVGAGVEKTFEAPYTFNLPEGEHTVHFQAADAAGNVTTGTGNVRVDGTAPDTTITSTTDASATFAFESNEPGSTFRCRVYVDGTPPPDFGSCSGTGAHTATGLAPGTYRFEALAADEAGNEDPTPAARTFTVLAPPPSGGGGGTQAGGQTGGQLGQVTQTSSSSSQGGTVAGGQRATTKAGKCAKLKGRKRAACVKKSCAKLKKKNNGAKRYKICVRAVTRKA